MERPIIIAHRGASAYAPENTMPAFKKAMSLGAEGIELDVQMTSDGYLVVIHDEIIDRTSNGAGRVVDMGFDALRQYDYGKWFAPEFTGESIPLLQEVLTLLRDWEGLLNIEIKNNEIPYPGIEEAVLKLLHQNDFTDRVILSSFNHDSMRRVRELAPKVRTALLYSFSLKGVPYRQAPAYDVGGVHPYYLNVNRRMTRCCHQHDLLVIPYTVDKPSAIRRLLAAGVDGIITNQPNVALEVRGQAGL